MNNRSWMYGGFPAEEFGLIHDDDVRFSAVGLLARPGRVRCSCCHLFICQSMKTEWDWDAQK